MPVVSDLSRTISCTVTCRQFYKLDIRSTENLRNPAATSRFVAIKVTTVVSIHDSFLQCKYFFHEKPGLFNPGSLTSYGAYEIRTHDLYNANVARSQLR